MKKTKREVKLISKVAIGELNLTNTLFYGTPDGKVYAIYYQFPEHVPVEFVLVECFGLYYDYTKEIVLKDVRQGDLIVREPILKSELNTYLCSYRCPNSKSLRTSSTVTELVDCLNSMFNK